MTAPAAFGAFEGDVLVGDEVDRGAVAGPGAPTSRP